MKKFTLVSKSRIIFALILSALITFYSFNFVPRNINVAASRTLGRQMFGYAFNFTMFFVGIYLALCLLTYIYQKLFARSK